MLSRLFCDVKMCKKVLTRNLLDRLVSKRIGTREVQKGVSRMYRNKKNMRRQHRTVNIIMKDKLIDSEDEVKKAKTDFERATKEYREEIPQGTIIDSLFNVIVKKEMEKIWNNGKKKNSKKIEMLAKSKEIEIKERIQNKEREDTKKLSNTKTVS